MHMVDCQTDRSHTVKTGLGTKVYGLRVNNETPVMDRDRHVERKMYFNEAVTSDTNANGGAKATEVVA